MKKPKMIAFNLFRYQILPKDRSFQPSLFDKIKTLEDLIARKNDIFAETLSKRLCFKTKKSTIHHKLIFSDQDSFLYKFAANRSIVREKEDFTEEELANWPSFYVFIWNNPDKQIIAIQERATAFSDTSIVIEAIVRAINIELNNMNLRVHYKPTFLDTTFWEIVKENEGKIQDIEFELITPNMSNISSCLPDELKNFAKNTNTAKTNLDIIADPDSAITIDQNDPTMKGLVEYSSQGCGDVSFKIRGLKKRLHTKNAKKQVTIEELLIEGHSSDVISTIKGIVDL